MGRVILMMVIILMHTSSSGGSSSISSSTAVVVAVVVVAVAIAPITVITKIVINPHFLSHSHHTLPFSRPHTTHQHHKTHHEHKTHHNTEQNYNTHTANFPQNKPQALRIEMQNKLTFYIQKSSNL
jgi:ABC-type nickel/cobalt efflux system permease component RcnA